MLSTQDQLKIIEILKPLNPTFIGVFGSYARGEETEDSDLDLMVDFNKGEYPGFRFFEVQHKISDTFNKKVDLATPNGIHKLVKKYVEKDLVKFYERK